MSILGRNRNPIQRSPQESMAITIANLLNKGIGAAALVTMMRLDEKGRALLQQAATLTEPSTLLDEFRNDPASWKHLDSFTDEQLNKFAADFIEAAKR